MQQYVENIIYSSAFIKSEAYNAPGLAFLESTGLMLGALRELSYGSFFRLLQLHFWRHFHFLGLELQQRYPLWRSRMVQMNKCQGCTG
jgi:hypothetical protein